jgi:hypothetical protein
MNADLRVHAAVSATAAPLSFDSNRVVAKVAAHLLGLAGITGSVQWSDHDDDGIVERDGAIAKQ